MRVRRVHRIAERQDGLITRAQALAAGATPAMIRHAISADGPWQVVLPGIYATFTGPLDWTHRLRAATLHGGAGCMVTGATACRMRGLRYGPDPAGVIDVLVDARNKVASAGFVRVHRTTRLPVAQWWLDTALAGDAPTALAPWNQVVDELAPSAHRGLIPVAPVPRAVHDTVGRMPPQPELRLPEQLRSVRALLCEAVQRRACTVDELLTELADRSRQGTALARRAMQDITAGCRSAPECELRDLFRSSRILPEPRWNEPLPGYRAISPDACLVEARLVVEVDSVAWHRYGDRYEATEKRRALYARLGWTVLPVSPYRLRTEPAQVRREVEQAYLAGLRARIA